MADAAVYQSGQWHMGLSAELVTRPLDFIITVIDKYDKSRNHPELSQLRGLIEKEKKKVTALITSVKTHSLSDKEFGTKLTELSTAIMEDGLPLALATDKDDLAAKIQAFCTSIAAKWEEIYKILRPDAVEFVKNSPGH